MASRQSSSEKPYLSRRWYAKQAQPRSRKPDWRILCILRTYDNYANEKYAAENAIVRYHRETAPSCNKETNSNYTSIIHIWAAYEMTLKRGAVHWFIIYSVRQNCLIAPRVTGNARLLIRIDIDLSESRVFFYVAMFINETDFQRGSQAQQKACAKREASIRRVGKFTFSSGLSSIMI